MYTKSNYNDYNYNIFRMLLQKKEILKRNRITSVWKKTKYLNCFSYTSNFMDHFIKKILNKRKLQHVIYDHFSDIEIDYRDFRNL